MIDKIIDYSIKNKALILIITLLIIIAGIFAIKNIDLDAIPDLSETQVIIRTDYAQQTPNVIEDQITYPITTAMLGLPNTKVVRGFSMFGTSFVYIVFEQGTDLYWARSRVLEKISELSNNLQNGVNPNLGVDATGVGWVFQYVLQDKTSKHDLADLRSLQDWFIKFELSTVKGVAQVASVGGFVKEYQVSIEPNKLRAYNLKLADIVNALKQVSSETSGRTLEIAESEYLIATKAYAKSIKDIQQAVVKTNNGIPILVKDIANVVKTPAFRRGIAEYNGQGEAVGGIVIMRDGNNALDVINRVKQKLKTIKQGLPEGVEIIAVYDRSKLINSAINNLKNKLIEESIIVSYCSILAAFLYSSPDEDYQNKAKKLSIFSSSAWVCLFVYCLYHCLSSGHMLDSLSIALIAYHNFIEILLIGFIPSTWLILMLRKAYPTQTKITGTLTILGSLTLAMVCSRFLDSSYQETHMLIWQYSPVLLIAITGYWFSEKLLSK